MRRFTQLYWELDSSNRTLDKVAALKRYFSDADPADAAWAVSLLSGRRIRRALSSSLMQQWAAELAGIPDWLFTECYDAVGDLAETIALVLPESPAELGRDAGLAEWISTRIIPLSALDEEGRKLLVTQSWSELDARGRFVFNKLITGAFRVGVSQELVTRALAQVSGLEGPTIAHRMMGDWSPSEDFYIGLLAPDDGAPLTSRPYPFCLAHPLDGELEALGSPEDWQIEWKWDGIRAQIIRRGGQSFIWSRGEELITDRFPEIREVADHLPEGSVLDGEILAWDFEADHPQPFTALQRRIGRQTLSKKILQEVPAKFIAFDLLEWSGEDMRPLPLSERRGRLEALYEETGASGTNSFAEELGISQPKPNWMNHWSISEALSISTWEEACQIRHSARERNVEGFMLKRLDSPYQTGRKKGAWWKWKVEPFTVDAVVMYAQRGSGKRASLYTDYTFGIWDSEGKLVPFAKAYSGLTDEEIRRVDAWVRKNTLEKFGPVRTVTHELVMELAFEGIQLSSRHKSGIAVRFPRISRWRHDKKPTDADTLESVKALLGAKP